MRFLLQKTDTETRARAGRLVLSHGEVDTPVFMPVGTQAT
ncbi:MAG TPA: tRNA guanosine(34) transglycosylase Tgt, partial [bacterium]|nr:tRNA guanosine(34) transglycosylase Tgt [bacterium]